MDMKELEKYQLKEIIQPQDNTYDEMITYLLGILNDRTIPEDRKHNVRKQFNEIMRLKSISMKPPIIVLEPKEDTP
jgi:hypothetical protein